jgi:hypothetical protein
MNVSHDRMGVVEGRALLEELPQLCFVVLRDAQLEVQPGEGVRCSFELPEIGRRSKTAETALAAIRAAMYELIDVLTRSSVQEWPKEWHRLVGGACSFDSHKLVSGVEGAERFRAKARQLTIGVTMPVKLKEAIQVIAETESTSYASVSRDLAAVAFEEFEDRIFSESSTKLIAALASGLNRWSYSETEQVMLRLEPSVGIRLRATAKEYSRSASEFAALFIAHGYDLKLRINELEQKIDAVRGPSARDLARKVGLDGYVALLSSVLVGSVVTPKKVLKRLSEIFEGSEQALSEIFSRSFESKVIPAFKKEGEKPQVATSPTSWEEAVKSLNLKPDKTKELLHLDD